MILRAQCLTLFGFKDWHEQYLLRLWGNLGGGQIPFQHGNWTSHSSCPGYQQLIPFPKLICHALLDMDPGHQGTNLSVSWLKVC